MTWKRPAASVAVAALLAACGPSAADDTAPSPTPEATTAAPTAAPSPTATADVDLSTIPADIDEAYVAALAEATAALYADLAEHTAEGGGLGEEGRGILSQNVVVDERERLLTQFEDAFDGTLVRPATPFDTELVEVGSASATCASAIVVITWSPFAGGKYAELDGRQFWMIWVGDEGGDGTTAWDLVGIRVNAEGGITEDPCTA